MFTDNITATYFHSSLHQSPQYQQNLKQDLRYKNWKMSEMSWCPASLDVIWNIEMGKFCLISVHTW